MEDVKVLTILELIHGARALTGAASLNSFPSCKNHPSSSESHRQEPRPHSARSIPVPNPKILTSLNHPAILIGTVTLPSLTLRCPNRSCLQFSDDSSTVCCDILDIDACVIGKRIRVLAWNFIPSKRCGGFLEIIKWKFLYSSNALGPCSSLVSLPLVSGPSSASECNSKSCHVVHGALESISPVSVVPCSIGVGVKGLESGFSMYIRGFLVRIIACECKLCSSKESMRVLHNGTLCHSFTKPAFLYFCGSASCWHPVITKLVGCVVTLSGLKKKLIFIGKEESQLAFVTTEDSVLHLPRLFKKWLPSAKAVIKGKGECGCYTGIVKGMYMQGMVVELDKEVWLLLTDELLTPPHGLRVGAVISVRNVHFVNPNFSWTKMLILGACFKTSITVESFSPLESGCLIASQFQSLLGKFIESLAFSARFWMLLVISCFRKKFAGILSEKEILGSKHKEGLVVIYANAHLPMSVFQARLGVFREFCKHGSCECNNEPSSRELKLVLPISSFIYHAETKLIKMLLRSENDCHIPYANYHFSFLSSKGELYGQSKRRIFPSEDLGIVLLGSLKISTSSGKLELFDTTGSIDVITPDLPSTWNADRIYEVIDYSLTIEGVPELVDHLGFLDKSFSCRTIFHCNLLERERIFPMFIYFQLNATCRNIPLYPSLDLKDDFNELKSGTFHLFMVTHKFPVLRKLHRGPVILNSSSMFVEAILLPWDLFLAGKDYQEDAPSKRHRTMHTSGKELTSGLIYCLGDTGSKLNTSCSDGEYSKEHKCGNLSTSQQIQCLATVRCVNNSNLISPGTLYHSNVIAKADVHGKPIAVKVLLEFPSERFSTYHWLQIGGYYILKHHVQDSFCNIKQTDQVNTARVLLTSATGIQRLCFSFSDVLTGNKSSNDASVQDSSISSDAVVLAEEDELLLQGGPSSSPGTCSDVSLLLPTNVKGFLGLDLKDLETNLIKPAEKQEQTYNVSSCNWTALTMDRMPSGPSHANCLLPEGNLISLLGDVIAIHGPNHCSDKNCEGLSDVLKLRFLHGQSCCIHVLVNHQIVKIYGSLDRHTYPTGFGPGSNVTFHRILELGWQNRLILTAVSFIVINSMGLIGEPYSKECCNWPKSNVYAITSPENVSAGLISELILQCMDYNPIRLRSRVVAVSVLVLEKNKKYDGLQSDIHCGPCLIDIPLAGFVLDDGSSTCHCWANAERASTLLRLREELPQRAFESSDWTFKWVGTDHNRGTVIYHLQRILKKHNRITVKNYGSMVDSSCQELTFSVSSDNTLTSSNEKLLKFMILNACFGTFWTVIASMMDSNAVRWLEKEHPVELETTVHSMKNVWAREVYYTSPITEARNMVQELLNR